MDEDEIVIIDDGEPTDTGDGTLTPSADEEPVPDVDDDADRPDEDWGETGVEDDANAQQTFTSQPVPPYRAGDLWENSGDTYVCINGKDVGESFAAADWVPAEVVVPTPTTTVRTVTHTEVIDDFSAESLASYQSRGAVAYALYDDGTRAQVQWSQVQEPTPTMPDVVANEALIVAQANNQHFWSRATDPDQDGAGTGAFVTDDEQDDFLEAAAQGFPDWGDGTQGTKPWHNLLMNSLGILLRTALNNLVSITRSAIAFFDGSGNQSANVVASFGKDGAQIGKDGESHIGLDYHSIKFIDKRGNVYMHVSDLLDDTGYAEITDEFEGDGSNTTFMLSNYRAAEEDGVTLKPITVTVSDSSGGTQDLTRWDRIIFQTPPTSGSTITATYLTDNWLAKAYTLGIRRSNRVIGAASLAEGVYTTASGMYSHAEGNESTASGYSSHSEGMDTTASGYTSHAEGDYTTASGNTSHAEGIGATASGGYSHAEGFYTSADGMFSHAEGNKTTASGDSSHAQNLETIAAKYAQTALGKYNAQDSSIGTYGTYAVIVGNGSDDSNRSNALTVAWNGNVSMGQVLGIHSQPSSRAKIDTSTNNGATSSAVVFGRTEIMDKNGTWVSTYGSNTQTNGQTRSYIGCNNMKTDGTMVTNYLNIGVNKDGSRFYAMTDPAAFRTALGFGDGTWETQDDTGPAVSVANSSWAKLTQVTLTAGHWLVLVGGYAASNNTGRRGFQLTSASSVTASRFLTALMAPPSGAALYTVIPYLVNPTASTTYNIFGYQNSGGNLNMSALVRAVHIYTA